MTTVLLDTHVLVWWSTGPDLLSRAATRAISRADTIAVASITWYELARLARQGRIDPGLPIRVWLDQLLESVRSIEITPAIASTAVVLPRSFPGDPADRLIYATAIELGLQLITRDERMHRHKHSRTVAIW